MDPEGKEVACMVSFVPTFEPQHPQDAIITHDTPEATELSEGKDYCFIFLVDRSGSMSRDRIQVTREALKLFVQSLPVGSQFAIIGFGTTYVFEETKTHSKIWDYNDQTMTEIINRIAMIEANYGGTNII